MENIKFALSSHSKEEKQASSGLIADCFDQAISTAYEQRYNWQFLENPAGTGTVLFAYHNEEPIGQITCIPCRYTFMDGYVPTALAGEWLCVSPKYRGRGLMSELISRISKLGNSQFPFVMDMPNKASMNGFQKALYYEMALRFLIVLLDYQNVLFTKNCPECF